MELTKKDIVFPDVPHEGTLGLVLHDMQGNEIFPETKDITYAELWGDVTDAWRETVAAYEENPNSFYTAWNYLDLHPAFWKFRHGTADPNPLPLKERLHVQHLEHEYGIHRCLDIAVGMVLDETGSGLRPQVWVEIELGQFSWPEEFDPDDPNSGDKNFHDYKLDCGGPTVEKAIIRAAYNVWCVYGNDRRVCDAPYNELSYKLIVDDETFEEMMRETGDDGEANERVRRASKRRRQEQEGGGGE